ncbi:exodeoxyribonuclease VII small subunit [Catenisphaera adipataccumulans]|jgi:exodeoxyribonuclease VII small subunit|uniref:Exodeoxyribonuclease 7 small subunit n=1 Tax=Catenisphaera adipataccumulans TaxID=700500 RepID=A0A7W8D0E8_9FIRM|nr:exodeoxyribonuclease VII small subunit [Catenisphaera adipataccumulans]MBB5183694.1 exodeoxyribonuclease VII small subunit [Catenisphaera adipataccumulans]
MEEKEYTFQEAMKRLDEIVTQLNAGDLELEKAMDLFTEGMKLSARCEKQLTEFEKKMNDLMKENGEADDPEK